MYRILSKIVCTALPSLLLIIRLGTLSYRHFSERIERIFLKFLTIGTAMAEVLGHNGTRLRVKRIGA
jgi:hypothetical protein